MKKNAGTIFIYLLVLSLAFMGYFSLYENGVRWYVRFNYLSIILGFISIVQYFATITIKHIRFLLYFIFVCLFLNIVNRNNDAHYLHILMIMCVTITGYIIGIVYDLNTTRMVFKPFAFILFPFLIVFTIMQNGQLGYETETLLRDKLFLLPVLFPFFVVQGKKVFELITYFLLVICSVITLKRSLVIASVFLLPFYFFYLIPNRRKNKFMKLALLFLVVWGIVYLFPVIDKSITGGVVVERLMNSQEDGGSGRDELYDLYFAMIFNGKPKEMLLGHELNNTIITGNAHNDLLLIAYRYGLVGLLFYLMYVVFFFKKAIWLLNSKRTPDYMRVVIWSTILPFLILGSLNCFFDQCSYYYVMLLIGYIIGQSYKLKEELN